MDASSCVVTIVPSDNAALAMGARRHVASLFGARLFLCLDGGEVRAGAPPEEMRLDAGMRSRVRQSHKLHSAELGSRESPGTAGVRCAGSRLTAGRCPALVPSTAFLKVTASWGLESKSKKPAILGGIRETLWQEMARYLKVGRDLRESV